jgi:hypothetical protein
VIIPKNLKNIIRLGKFLFTPVAFSFLGYFAWQSRETLITLLVDAKLNWLVFSTILWILLHFISPLFTSIVFKSYAISLAYKDIFFIHTNRLPTKYLPGGIWHTVARANDYYKKGISIHHLSSYLLFENVIVSAVTLTLGGSIVLRLLKSNTIWFYGVSLVITISIFIIILLPWIIKRFFLNPQQSFMISTYTYSILCLFFYWIVAAIAFVSFLHSFSGIELLVSDIEAGGIYIFSWGIGFITIFAPQGIGVSEFISGKLLTSDISAKTFIPLLFSFRFVVLIGDLLAWLISLLLGNKKLRF